MSSPLSTPSLTSHVVPIEAGAHVVAAHWLKDTPALALADGTVILSRAGAPERVAAHPEAGILVAAGDADRLVTGGDDGRIVEIRGDGSAVEVAAAKGGAWIDALALHGDGGLAWSAGRAVTARDAKGRERTLTAPSSARGLAFAPKGYRLAVAHYNGVSLWYPNHETPPEVVAWKGSHIDVTWSTDGRFVITTMQENALHGWRLQPDRGHMRMSGYPGKVRSVSWSSDGHWLATGGAEAAIIWPFDSKEGPTGKAPRECGVRPARVARVAFHPRSPVLAIGYEDGCVLLVRLTDAAELLVRPAVAGSAISALAWDGRGERLVFGCADGQAGLLSLPG
ncbi:WD40 repeat domain-containing protein [Methylobacterium sp. NEAU 140]|uniref:WD40 repeat domain-containing protein n=1 Tax=Methylobacterium sp. NEAU 140 TaxID=3064945 RepID=UPI0027360DD5|nr:WD40 repeat domain-containing protein [Methylobacterium sp. NEAU 140]MDP4023056.1 WD40 repeat domain-containing protein [Methylobacterium sp. NEAU 140]